MSRRRLSLPALIFTYLILICVIAATTMFFISNAAPTENIRYDVSSETGNVDESRYEISHDGHSIAVYLPDDFNKDYRWTYGSSNDFFLKHISSETASFYGYENDCIKMIFDTIENRTGDVVLTFEYMHDNQSKPGSKMKLSLHVDENNRISVN